MKMKVLCGAAIAALTLMSGVVIAQSIQPGYALMATRSTQSAYTCSSIHFGMNDTTLFGSWSGSGSTWAPVVDGVTIRNYEANERVYFSENNALKFNSSKVFDGQLTLTLDYNVKQCTVYAAGWKDKTPTLDINGVSHEIAGNAAVTNNSGTVIYTPYVYVLPEESNILVLSAPTERLVIGDLALRITSYVSLPDPDPDPDPDPGQTELSVTFNQTELAASPIESKNGITLSNSSDYGTTMVTELRIYKSQTLTISGATITSIEFTCTANGTTKQGPGCFGAGAPSGYTFETNGKKGTWTGSATSIVFTATDNQVRITQIVITYLA